LFGYFASTQFFGDMTDINIKQMLFDERMKEIQDDVPAFGFIDDGSAEIARLEAEENASNEWQVWRQDDW